MNKNIIRENKRLKHGMWNTTEYHIWQGMRQRCQNLNYHGYKRYGGRGIKVCDRWQSFVNFFEDMGFRPSKLYSIDRINNDGNYEPENCRWATKEQQFSNRSKGGPVIKRISFSCKKCSKEYFKVKWYVGKSFYCSDKCRLSAYQAECLKCKKEIKATPSKPNKYCSSQCYWESMKKCVPA